MVDWGSLVDWGRGMVNWGSFVSWGRGMVSWSSLVGRSSIIVSLTRVSNIGHVSTVTISNIVGNSLNTAIRESNTVTSLGRVTITRLISIVVSSTVVIIDTILVAIHSRLIIAGLSISWGTISGADSSTMGSGDTGENNEGLQLCLLD